MFTFLVDYKKKGVIDIAIDIVLVYFFNFGQISHIVLVFLFLTLSKYPANIYLYKAIIKTLKKLRNMFKVNNKNTRTMSPTFL